MEVHSRPDAPVVPVVDGNDGVGGDPEMRYDAKFNPANEEGCRHAGIERQVGDIIAAAAEVNQRAVRLIRRQPRTVRAITADNGTEFHSYPAIERATAARFYFATPHHAWERGTCENPNGLLRQYLPKRKSMAHLTQHDCNRIAAKLNRRLRKRLSYRTPEECYVT